MDELLKYPCVMRDDDSQLYFVAESTGPRSWIYYRWWLRAWIELHTGL
jgi:hypothetical protein